MNREEWVAGFWRRVLRLGARQCWLWTGTRVDGYGQLKRQDGQTNVAAHRASYEINRGHIPRGKVLMHSCDNPPCVNPNHLRVGTQRDNIMDMHKKGRASTKVLRGDQHGSSKITEAQVAEIRRRYAARAVAFCTQDSLAREYGITQAQVSRILSRKRR